MRKCIQKFTDVILYVLFDLQGAEIISLMVRNMPNEVFTQLARHGSVGLFTAEESTTIFPEYAHLADTRKCKGECDLIVYDRNEGRNCCNMTYVILKVIYHPLYNMNKFVTNKSKLRQDGAQLFPYMG